MEKSGGLKITKLMVEKYYKKSMKVIDELTITSAKKDKLIELLNKASRNS